MVPHRKSESGNVFAIILLGIFLLGALMYMFQRSANQGTGNISKQQASIAAQEILNYARLVEGAVDRVRRNGCSESEISFDNAVVAGYSNPNSPINESCHIFSDNGGKITYLQPPETWNDNTQSTEDLYNELYFNSRTCIQSVGVGPAACADGGRNYAEILLHIPFLKKEICANINQSIRNTPDILVDTGNSWTSTNAKSNGTFINSTVISAAPGNPTICFESSTHPPSGTYHLYHVLLAR